MAKDSNDLKSNAFIEQHGLRDKITLSESGVFGGFDELHEQIVLAGSGVTVDQLKKMQKLEGELLPAVTLLAGELSADFMKKNPESNELGFSYKIGSNTTASGIFSRSTEGAISVVNAVETKVNSAEMKRVHSFLDGLFEGVNT
jgi:hypothetical protein